MRFHMSAHIASDAKSAVTALIITKVRLLSGVRIDVRT